MITEEKNLLKQFILLGLARYELIITNSASGGHIGYIYQLTSGVSSKNNC